MDWQDQQPAGGHAPQHQYADGEVKKAVPGDTGVEPLLREAWEAVKTNPVPTIGGMLLVLGVIFAVQMITNIGLQAVVFGIILAGAGVGEVAGPEAATGLVIAATIAMSLIIMVITMMAQMLMMAIYNVVWLRLVRGQTNQPINWTGIVGKFAIPLLLGGLLQAVAIYTGVLAFIVGAIIVGLGLAMMPFLIVDWDLSAMQALKKSWSLMDGHKTNLFILGLALFVLNLVGMIPCGLGLIVTAPMSSGAMALFYTRIARAGDAYLRV